MELHTRPDEEPDTTTIGLDGWDATACGFCGHSGHAQVSCPQKPLRNFLTSRPRKRIIET